MFTLRLIRQRLAYWTVLQRPAGHRHSSGGLSALHRFQRSEKLKDVYKPFDKLEKGSKEYQELARSGQVWEDYFKPGDSKKLGYSSLQRVSLFIYLISRCLIYGIGS